MKRKSISCILILTMLVSILFSFTWMANAVADSIASPWQSIDVGAVGATGSALYSNGVFTGEGAGADIYGSADAFRYIYQNITGDCTVIARVTSQQNTDWYAKAGIMVRETTNAGSKYFGMFHCPSNTTAAQWRGTTDNWTDNANGASYLVPVWFKIVREGNSFSGYTSSDGTIWTLVRAQSVAMAGDVTVGMVVCSHVYGTLNTSSFDNVSVTTQGDTLSTPTPTPTITPSPTPLVPLPAKLTLNASMVVNESGLGNAGLLVDEQNIAGDPPSGTCTTYWHPGWAATTYPASVYIDLGENYVITKVYLRDIGGSGDYVVSTGSPGNWTPLFTDNLIPYHVWTPHMVENVTTSHIRCTMMTNSSNVAEIVVYGYPVGGEAPEPTPSPTPTPGPVKIAVLGSSSVAGAGPTDPSNAWVNRYRTYMQSLNPNNQVINMGYWGYTTYHEMPTSFVPPPGRPAPDPNYSISKAVAMDVDAIIISLPTNDIASGYSIAEYHSNIDAMIAVAQAAGIPVWISTSMPRDSVTNAQRQDLISINTLTHTWYGVRTIDFWTDLADSTGHIVPQYATGDTIHFNDAAHLIMHNRVVSKTPDILYAIRNGIANP